MAAVVVADASVLIALDQIGQLSLLQKLFVVVLVPPAVAKEVAPSLPQLPSWNGRDLSTDRRMHA